MALAIKRTEFLRGNLGRHDQPIRPPWGRPELQFRSHCNSCGDCIEKCPTHIIEFGRGLIPLINFNNGECLLCGDCLRACPTGALHNIEGQVPWSIHASIDNSRCLAFKGVECRSCQDPCEAQAIKILTLVGGFFKPLLDASLCNGCGACYSVCPANAIEMKAKENL